jgi:uncharacterized protein (DUF736 family)
MTKDYDNTNRGALFRNSRKEKDSHPDHQGTLNVGGVDYWISAWVKTSGKGQKYFSLSVKPKEAREAANGNDAQRETAQAAQ